MTDFNRKPVRQNVVAFLTLTAFHFFSFHAFATAQTTDEALAGLGVPLYRASDYWSKYWINEDTSSTESEEGYSQYYEDPASQEVVERSYYSNDPCCDFPLNHRPFRSYNAGMAAFGAGRGGGQRLHAATDLYGRQAENIAAITDGKVIRPLHFFYQGTYAIEVLHRRGFIARYGEMNAQSAASGMVRIGQVVGHMGTVNSGCCAPMLHLELYNGNARGPLTQSRGKFRRREDLVNPTYYVSAWETLKFRAR